MLQFILFIIVISHILQYVITEFDIHEHTEYIYTGNYTSRNETNKNIKLLFGLLFVTCWSVEGSFSAKFLTISSSRRRLHRRVTSSELHINIFDL